MKNLLYALGIAGSVLIAESSFSQKTEKTENGGFKEYDKKGKIVKESETVDGEKIQMEYEYNKKGEAIRIKRQFEYADNAKIDYCGTTHYKYDKKGRIIEEELFNDSKIDGIIERRDVTSYKYDKKGNLTEKKLQEDLGNTGKIGYSQTTYFKYDETGKVIEKKLERDLDGDGIIDETKILD